jgi:hypothetical protein
MSTFKISFNDYIDKLRSAGLQVDDPAIRVLVEMCFYSGATTFISLMKTNVEESIEADETMEQRAFRLMNLEDEILEYFVIK